MPAFKYQLSSNGGPISVEDYRRLARRALPGMVWAYIDFGADDMATMGANRQAFSRYMLRRKALAGLRSVDLTTMIAGQKLELPVLLAPTGSAGLSHWTGELGAAQAAERSGTLSIVSTAASYSFEEIAAATQKDHFFQLYPWADIATGRHEFTLSLMRRAQQSGYRAMFVTVDVPVPGNRESERRHGMGFSPVLTPARILSGARRPKWAASFIRHRRMGGRNLVDAVGARAALASIGTQYAMMRPELDWNDFAFMRDNWDGPVYVKGIVDADDAQRAVELGANGVVVSNHGGRQLDGDVAALDALPAISARIGDRAEVLVDGGIRRGSDIVKALCLGANAVCIGRPYLYGLAANGPAGVQRVISILREELTTTLTLMGVGSVKDLDPSWLIPADTVIG